MVYDSGMVNEAKTVIEWTYEPVLYFEVPLTLEFADGEIDLQEGVARGVFSASHYRKRNFRDSAHDFLRSRFLAQQVQVHKPFKLSVGIMSREHPDGRKDATAFIDTLVMRMEVKTPDIVLRDKKGNIVTDTKAERIEKHKSFGGNAVQRFQHDPLLKRMFQSFDSAVNDSDNSLIHLYEIREAVMVAYENERVARNALGVSKPVWNLLKRRANHEPLREGRHRGKHNELRKMTNEELAQSIRTAQAIIEGYLSDKLKE